MATTVKPTGTIEACTNMTFVASSGDENDEVGVELVLESIEYDADNGFVDVSYHGARGEVEIRIPAHHLDGLIDALLSVRDRARVALKSAPAIANAGKTKA